MQNKLKTFTIKDWINAVFICEIIEEHGICSVDNHIEINISSYLHSNCHTNTNSRL